MKLGLVVAGVFSAIMILVVCVGYLTTADRPSGSKYIIEGIIKAQKAKG